MRATFVEESMPPERKTPNGTSDIIRRRIDSRSRCRSRSRMSSSDMAATSAAVSGENGLQYVSISDEPSARTVMRWAGPSLRIPRNIVIGAGAQTKVR